MTFQYLLSRASMTAGSIWEAAWVWAGHQWVIILTARANLCKPKNRTGSSTEPQNQLLTIWKTSNLPRKKIVISKIAVRVPISPPFPNIKADPLRAAQSVPGVESNRSFPRRRNVPQKTFIVFSVRCYEWDYWSIGFQLFCLAWRNQKPWTWADWRKQWRAEDSWRKWRETEQETSRTRREPSIKRVSAPVCRFSKF